MTRAIVVLARAPSAEGKTRLTADLSDADARALRTALLLDTLDVARAAGVPLWLRYTPAAARDEMAALAGDAILATQTGHDLGARMFHGLIEAFAGGAGAAVVIGSDLPSLPASRIHDAFAALEAGTDCVFGPAEDGGYYLVGSTWRRNHSVDRARRLRDLFSGIDWGTDRVLEQSLAAARGAGLEPSVLAPWFDVDSPADLARLVADLHPGAPRTRTWCKSHLP